mmetsp:Transcript_14152/g.33381  ORF Transcript_14152/g.33381 Transcript_14152/m.33381 type:complete len:250 (-) Transcript_14152:5272-6021(-)
MAIVHSEHHWPVWPRVAVGPLLWWCWQQLQVDDLGCALPHSSADAIIASVAAANDHNLFALGIDGCVLLRALLAPPSPPATADVATIKQSLGVLGQVLHRKVDSCSVATGAAQVTGNSGADGQQHCIIALHELRGSGAQAAQVTCGTSNMTLLARVEGDTFLAHEVHAALHYLLLVCLHVWNAIHHQASNPVSSLIHRHKVPHLVELISSCQPSRPGADNGDLLAGANSWRIGHHPSHLPRLVNDSQLH